MQKKGKKKKMTLLQKRSMMGWLFILPWLAGFLIFYVRSLFMTGQFAFSSMTIDAINGGYKLDFVGIENFRYPRTAVCLIRSWQ